MNDEQSTDRINSGAAPFFSDGKHPTAGGVRLYERALRLWRRTDARERALADWKASG